MATRRQMSSCEGFFFNLHLSLLKVASKSNCFELRCTFSDAHACHAASNRGSSQKSPRTHLKTELVLAVVLMVLLWHLAHKLACLV